MKLPTRASLLNLPHTDEKPRPGVYWCPVDKLNNPPIRAKTVPCFARSLISGTPPPSSTLSTELSPAGEAAPHRSTLFWATPI